jgi:NDP-4-keto-2,6-dideoxyhexose 3-C-methyltransferase
LLKMHAPELNRVGIDPTSEKFKDFYPSDITRVANFFSADVFAKQMGSKRAKLVTSIAMFYDLPSPETFVADIARVLTDDGVWLFEQSYLPTMCSQSSYDTICHEHIEYYTMKPILWMLERNGLHLVDAEMTDANGGSISLIASKKRPASTPELVKKLVALEVEIMGPQGGEYFRQFRARVETRREQLQTTFRDLKKNHRIFGYGASTKGNVILQYCGFDHRSIEAMLEVNRDKFGCTTPGTNIPIVDESEVELGKGDVLLMLPWHFKSFFDVRLAPLKKKGVKLLYPLPDVVVEEA